MYVNREQQKVLHKIVKRLYAAPLTESLIREICKYACELVDAQYFHFDSLADPIFVSNSPPDFINAIMSIRNDDFMLRYVMSTHRECGGRRYYITQLQDEKWAVDFMSVVQETRPISDNIYFPVDVNGFVIGTWGLACAGPGPNGRAYTENQFEMLRFISSFINDAFQRSFIPPPLVDEIAYLDYQGNVIGQGPIIKEAFDRLFGKDLILTETPCHDDLRTVFRRNYAAFIGGTFTVGMDRFELCSEDVRYSFLFSLLNPEGLPLHVKGIPIASVQLLSREAIKEIGQVVERRRITRIYSLTKKEEDVALEILKGKMNKEIAETLGMDEGAVKWFTHSIYEKTGFRSRTQLVIGLISNTNNRPNKR